MKFPSAWSPKEAPAAKLEARINMGADVAGKGKCPECKKPMSVVVANGSRMWICAEDRITLPIPNDHEV